MRIPAALLTVVLVGVSCNDGGQVMNVAETRIVSATGEPDEVRTSAERFGFVLQAHGTRSGPLPSATFAWKTPPGWEQRASTPTRLANFKPGGHSESECYVSVLEGRAGGVEANINRWRDQLGQPELSGEAVAGLPRIEFLGQRCPFVEVEGDFTGMDGQTQKNWALVGAICELPGRTVFVKMVGPAAQVVAEKENFLALCRSLHYPE